MFSSWDKQTLMGAVLRIITTGKSVSCRPHRLCSC